MPQLKRKKSFVTPFSQASTVSSQQDEAKTELHVPKDKRGTSFSPVHLGRHVQIITPHTRQKIKQRFALGISRVSVRDTSPGINVPFDLSQASCMSQPADEHVDTDRKESVESEGINEVREEHTVNDDDTQGLDEEFDLEILEEVVDIEEEYVRNQDPAVAYGDEKGLGEANNITENVEETRMSTGAEKEETVDETDLHANVQSKKSKAEGTIKVALKSKKRGKRLGKGDKRTGQLVKSKKGFQLDDGSGQISSSRKAIQNRKEKELTKIHEESSEVGDFLPLTSSHYSQNLSKVKRKSKHSYARMKQEVLKTLFKMHNEIQELLERRKKLCTGEDAFERSESTAGILVHTKISGHEHSVCHDVLQEE